MKRLILIFAAMPLINGCICSGWEVNDTWKGTILDPERWERKKRVSKTERREMKCELCVKEGKTSKLHIGQGEMTDPTPPKTYYDEGGVLHVHRDKAGKRARIECSNGHKGWLIGGTKCISCTHGEEEKVVWDG